VVSTAARSIGLCARKPTHACEAHPTTRTVSQQQCCNSGRVSRPMLHRTRRLGLQPCVLSSALPIRRYYPLYLGTAERCPAWSHRCCRGWESRRGRQWWGECRTKSFGCKFGTHAVHLALRHSGLPTLHAVC
jgi:hypothetical protein